MSTPVDRLRAAADRVQEINDSIAETAAQLQAEAEQATTDTEGERSTDAE